MTSTKRTETRV